MESLADRSVSAAYDRWNSNYALVINHIDMWAVVNLFIAKYSTNCMYTLLITIAPSTAIRLPNLKTQNQQS